MRQGCTSVCAREIRVTGWADDLSRRLEDRAVKEETREVNFTIIKVRDGMALTDAEVVVLESMRHRSSESSLIISENPSVRQALQRNKEGSGPCPKQLLV